MERRTTSHDRRRQTFSAVMHGALRPRRRENRRPADDQVYLIDWHDSGLFALAMSIVLMSLVDTWFTLQILSLGGEEVNWLMKSLLDKDISTFLITKYVVTATGVVFLVAMARFRLAGFLAVRRILEMLAMIYACLMIYEVYLLVGVAGASLIP